MPSNSAARDQVAQEASRSHDAKTSAAAREALRGEIERGARSGAGIPADAVFAAVRQRIDESSPPASA